MFPSQDPPPEFIEATPDVANFPGETPSDAPRVTKSFTFSGNYEGNKKVQQPNEHRILCPNTRENIMHFFCFPQKYSVYVNSILKISIIGMPTGYGPGAPSRALMRSTGLYAAAGDVIRVTVSQAFLDSIANIPESKQPQVYHLW